MTPWVKRLLIANVAIYFLQHTVAGFTELLAFRPIFILSRPWTIVTYMFVHDVQSFLHIAFNMLVLYFIGSRVEERLGARNFITLYLVSGIFGALLSFLNPLAWIIGASGAVYGVLFAFAWYWPRERIYIWGVLPVEARMLVIIAAAASIVFGFLGLMGSGGRIAHFAHLGGFVGGFLVLKWIDWRSPARAFRRKAGAEPAKIVPDGAALRRWTSIPREELHEINREEVDRLLDKISKHGIKSLTQEERASLDRFSRS